MRSQCTDVLCSVCRSFLSFFRTMRRLFRAGRIFNFYRRTSFFCFGGTRLLRAEVAFPKPFINRGTDISNTFLSLPVVCGPFLFRRFGKRSLSCVSTRFRFRSSYSGFQIFVLQLFNDGSVLFFRCPERLCPHFASRVGSPSVRGKVSFFVRDRSRNPNLKFLSDKIT